MATHPSGKKLLDALRGVAHERPPVWLMRQAGRYLPEYRALRARAGSFLELCLTPALAAEATLQPIRRFGMDGAILFSDILIVPYGLGQPLGFRDGEGPVLEPLVDASELVRLKPAGFRERVAPIAETVRQVRAALPDDTTLIGFAGAPWTVATYMVEGGSSRDFARVKGWMFRDPVGFGRLIDRLIVATVEYLGLQIEAGAEAIQLFDSWAGVLAESEFEHWVVKPNAAIVERVKARYPDIPVILFPRGAGANYRAASKGVAAEAIGLDTTVPLAWARSNLQRRHTLQGNLDPLILVTGGAPLAHAVKRILQGLGKGPFVFNLGHGILPTTPPEHVAELVRLVRA